MSAPLQAEYPRTLEEILSRLTQVQGVEAVTIAREDGLVVAYRLPASIDAKRMAAMAAVLFGSGNRVAEELERGDLHHCWLQCEEGKAVAFRTPGSTILIALLSEKANVGLALLALEKAANEIGRALTTLLESQVP